MYPPDFLFIFAQTFSKLLIDAFKIQIFPVSVKVIILDHNNVLLLRKPARIHKKVSCTSRSETVYRGNTEKSAILVCPHSTAHQPNRRRILEIMRNAINEIISDQIIARKRVVIDTERADQNDYNDRDYDRYRDLLFS